MDKEKGKGKVFNFYITTFIEGFIEDNKKRRIKRERSPQNVVISSLRNRKMETIRLRLRETKSK